MATPNRRPVVFICYSHRDRGIKDRLVEHISILGETSFELWDDSQIRTGTDWRHKIDDALARADAGVLLISTDFLTSNFIKTVEVPKLLERPVYPILVGYCAWENVDWLAKLQMRTDAGKPLPTKGQKLDRALVGIAREMALLYSAAPAPAVEEPPAPAPEPSAEAASRVWVGTPDGYLFVVLQKDKQTGPIFNLQCRILNAGVAPITLEHLGIHLTDPHGSSFSLKWNVFYEGMPVQRKTGDAAPLTLPSGSDQSIGIQFVGPPSIANYQWSQGLYRGEWRGRLTGEPSEVTLSLCEILVTEENAKDLIYWGRAGAAQWDALGDPDNAVGIPVMITQHSPAPAR